MALGSDPPVAAGFDSQSRVLLQDREQLRPCLCHPHSPLLGRKKQVDSLASECKEVDVMRNRGAGRDTRLDEVPE